MRTHKYCPKCRTQLRRATKWWEKDAGYKFLCNKCDENYFRFEVLTTKYLKRSNYGRYG